jgi:hypothetical protein
LNLKQTPRPHLIVLSRSDGRWYLSASDMAWLFSVSPTATSELRSRESPGPAQTSTVTHSEMLRSCNEYCSEMMIQGRLL